MSGPRSRRSKGPRSVPPPNTRRGASAPAEAAPPASKKKPAEPPPIGTIASVGALLTLLLGAAFLSLLWGSGGGGRGDEVEVFLPENAGAGDVAEMLEQRGVVRRWRLFSMYLRIFWDAGAIQPGPHLLADNLKPRDLAARLVRDPGREKVQVTIPEGWTRMQMARRLQEKRVCASQAFLDATAHAPLLRELGIPAENAEGYLFPATYQLALDSDPKQTVKALKAEFDRRFARIKASARPDGGPVRELGWSLHQVVTLASVVEREAAIDDERPLVASAFLNRFRDPNFTPKPPKLQSDATTIYGCQALRERIPSCASFNGRVTPEMNHDPQNPYSTYAHPGLPPGPIASPGERSLLATVSPADTEYLYFVGKGGGRHTFSKTLQEHNTAVRLLRELRQGH